MISRTDVLKKTILRALRSQYWAGFSEYLYNIQVSKRYSIEEFKEYLDQYAATLQNQENKDEILKKYGKWRTFPSLLASLLVFERWNKSEKSSWQLNLQNEFNAVLYKYSHEKFNKFTEYAEVRFLMDRVLVEEKLEDLLETNPTLRKKKERFRVCMHQLMERSKELAEDFINEKED